LVALILVLGVAAYIYQMHAAATGTKVEGVSVAGFTLEGFNPPTDIAPDGLHLTFQVLVYNPASTPLELDRLTFTPSMWWDTTWEKELERIHVHANGETPIHLELTSEQATRRRSLETSSGTLLSGATRPSITRSKALRQSQ